LMQVDSGTQLWSRDVHSSISGVGWCEGMDEYMVKWMEWIDAGPSI